MKKSFLLFSACLVAGFANAQSQHMTKSFNRAEITNRAPEVRLNDNAPFNMMAAPVTPIEPISNAANLHGAKTTSGGGRWYNFADLMLNPYQLYVSKGTYGYFYTLWNDTTALEGFTVTSGTPYFHTGSQSAALSLGLGFDPTYSSTSLPIYGWNTGTGGITDFTGAIAVTYADAYTIDSAFVSAIYHRSTIATPAKVAVVDTLILAFVKSNRTGTGVDLPSMVDATPPTGYGVLAINYKDLYRDIANNRAAHNGGTALTGATEVYKFLLYQDDSITTSSSTFQFPRTSRGTHPADPVINFAVGANQIAAMTATFKSGDTSYHLHAGVPGDTIRYSSGTAITGYKYNIFQAEVDFATTTSSSPTLADVTFCFADNSNQSCGYFGFEANGFPAAPTKYYPQWSIIAGGTTPATYGPASAQYPAFAYHINCATCGLVGAYLNTNETKALSNVTVTPNPVNDIVNLSFTTTAATATVALYNSVGQVVASKVVTNGNAQFDLSTLANGTYLYSISALDGKSSGRIVVAH